MDSKMKQALLYSKNAEHLVNILNGRKTIEARKRDLPQWAKDKIARGEKVIGYGYCTMGKPYLIKHPYHAYMLIDQKGFDNLNGRVVVKFEVSGSDEIRLHKHWNSEDDYDEYLQTYKLSNYELCDKACLSNEQLENYLTEALGYAHHFTNIQPVNMELREFYKCDSVIEPPICEKLFVTPEMQKICVNKLTVQRPPQSFQSAWVKGE